MTYLPPMAFARAIDLEREEGCYLKPVSLSAEEAARIYAPNAEEDARELAMARGALRSLRDY